MITVGGKNLDEFVCKYCGEKLQDGYQVKKIKISGGEGWHLACDVWITPNNG